MKLCELRERLTDLDPNLEVLCYTEDSSLVGPGRTFLLLDIQAVSTPRAERTESGDGAPYLTFGKSAASKEFVVLELRPSRG
jgi:hypothetical protein